jgi:hypothetical protein
LSVGTLVLAGGVFGFLLGQRSVASESDLIERAAADHVARGGERLDCVGLPGQGGVWIMVRCGSGAEASLYAFDHAGRQVPVPAGPDA